MVRGGGGGDGGGLMGCMKELEEHDHAWDLLDDCGMICGAVACCLTCMTNGLCGR